MKKLSLLTTVATGIVSLLATSCMKDKFAETTVPPGFKVVEFYTSSEMTKTFISGDDTEVTWVQGDEIRIFYEGGTTTATAANSGSYSVFRAVVPENSTCYAAYPSTISTFQDNAFSVTIPAEQDGTFANGHVALAQLKEKETSRFHNVTSFLKVVVDDNEYTKVVVKAVGGENIAGTLPVTLEGDQPVIGTLSDGSDEIALNVSAPGTYYIAIAPETEFTKGILATYYKGDTAAGSYFLDGDFTISRAMIARVGVLEERIGNYYVSPTGANAKTGESEENAMSTAELRTLLDSVDTDKAFAQAATLDGAVIHLAEGTYDMGELVTMSYGGRKVKIDFRGVDTTKTVITGGTKHRIFVIGSGVNVSFEKIAFRDSRSYVSTEPGILLKEGSESKFINCLIADNVNEDADPTVGHHSQAGIKTYGKSYFDSCVFTRNRASYGASLTIDADATVKNCKFIGNRGIHGPGNSLYVDANCTVNVESCSFMDNRTELMDGGAVAISAGKLNMTSCSFINNSNDGRRGGALYAWNFAKVILTDCTMTANYAGYGGAVFMQDNSELEIRGGLFSGNYAKGGGFLQQSGNSKVLIKVEARIEENYATGGHGGAILMGSEEGFLTCENVIFKGNYNNSRDSIAWGGAIGTTGKGTTTITGCLFLENHSLCYGGAAMSMQGSANGVISGCTFRGNYSDCEGITDSNANGRYGGGALRFDSKGTVSVESCSFESNHLSIKIDGYNHAYGGAVYINAGGNYRFTRCKFKSNYAVRGGAFCAWATGAKIYMNACGFDGNYISYRNGTTIHIEKAEEFCMNNCSINDNTWTINGNKGWQASWVNLSTIKNICLSNCSFIGSPRFGSVDHISDQPNSIVRFDSIQEGYHYFINNIVVTEGPNTCNRSFSNYNTKDNYAYFTRRSDNSANGAGGSWTMLEQTEYKYESGCNGFGKSMFDGLVWDEFYMCWKWSGVLTYGGGHNNAKGLANIIIYYISTFFTGFWNWLATIDGFYWDPMGNPRPAEGEWLPGAASGVENPNVPEGYDRERWYI